MRRGALLGLVVAASGCYRATVETGASPSAMVVEKPWASGWILGLVPPSTVETVARCPHGVSAVVTELSFPNQLVSFLTLGIYTPMSIKATCAEAPSLAQVETPDPARAPGPGVTRDTIRIGERSPDDIQRREDARRRERQPCTPSDVLVGLCTDPNAPRLGASSGAGAAGSEGPRRGGFWIGFGFGYGSLGAAFDDCPCPDCEQNGDLSGYLKLGGTVSSNMLLGFESNTWLEYSDGDFLSVGIASLALYGYPSPESGFFIKGGGGLATLGQYFGGEYDAEHGFGAIVGLGYDARISANTSVTPVVNYQRGWFDGFTTNVIQVGLGFTFH